MSVDPNQLIQQLLAGAGSGGGMQAGGQMPPNIMQQIMGGGSGPGGESESGQSEYGGDPLQAVQSCLNDIHQLIATLPDPEDTRLATQAMMALLQIQKKMMAQQGQGGQ